MTVPSEPRFEILGEVKASHRLRNTLLIVIPLLILAAMATGAGWYISQYSQKVVPHTTLAKQDISGMGRAQVKELLAEKQSLVNLELTGAVSRRAPLSELGITPDTEATLRQIFAPNTSGLKMLTALVTSRQIEPALKVDQRILQTWAHSILGDLPDRVQDPVVAFDSESQSFKPTGGRAGKGIDPDKILRAARTGLNELTAQKLSTTYETLQPISPDPNLSTWAQQANQLISPEVTVAVNRSNTIAVSPADKSTWVVFPTEKKLPRPAIDPPKVQAWLDAQAEKYVNSQAGKGKRIVNNQGQLVKLLLQAQEGLGVDNIAQLTQGIAEALGAGQPFTGEFNIATVPGKYDDEVTDRPVAINYDPKPGEKWISVDITNHTATAFEGRKIVLGPLPVVTGSIPSPTPPGRFAVYDKRFSQVMKGNAWDGRYEVFVPWVMYFHLGYAIHGAPWRGDWVYHPYSGSHGCVNVQVSQAKWLWEWAPIGTPVITHE